MSLNISEAKFKIENIIHQNDALGTVCGIVQDEEYGECFVKIINYGKFPDSKSKKYSLDIAKKEAEVLQKVSSLSKNVPKFYGCHNDKKAEKFTIVMQKMQGESLAEWMKKHPASKMDKSGFFARRKIVQQICEIMQKINVVHRDLKPENILIRFQDGRWVISIIDFGCAGLDSVRNVGTAGYHAPEQSELYYENLSVLYGQETDIFAIGQIYYELLLGRVPVFGVDYIYSSSQKKWKKQPSLPENLLKMPDGVEIDNLLKRMTVFNPIDRKYDAEYKAIIKTLNNKTFKRYNNERLTNGK